MVVPPALLLSTAHRCVFFRVRARSKAIEIISIHEQVQISRNRQNQEQVQELCHSSQNLALFLEGPRLDIFACLDPCCAETMKCLRSCVSIRASHALHQQRIFHR